MVEQKTTKKTDLGNLNPGDIVNIERSLKTGDRLEGHFVLGHVDGVGIIKKILKRQEITFLRREQVNLFNIC